MNKIARYLMVLSLSFILAGCGMIDQAPEDIPPTDVPVIPEEIPAEVTPETVAQATIPSQVETMLYIHPSGVFYLNIPGGWEVFDESDDLELSVRFIPPPGYGSRMNITVTNEGPLTPEGQKTFADGIIAAIYEDDPRYEIIEYAEDGVGRFIIEAFYDDGTGGSGVETMILQQAGPFFATQRVFISSPDEAILGESLQTSAGGLSLDSLASWGSQAAGINPAELLITNSRVWTSDSLTIFAGDVYNASANTVSDIQVRAAFCSSAGSIRKEVIEPAVVSSADPGEFAPFYIAIEDLPRNTGVCIRQATGKPAVEDPGHVDTLGVELALSRDEIRGDTIASGRVYNTELTAITNLVLTILLYDEDGRIIGMAEETFEAGDLLMPGLGYAFSITFDDLGGTPVNYRAYTRARLFNLNNPSLNP